ncbi:hypothetical protein [Polaromonas sp. UC242_47]|uniref:hypothetical protein n=1 Tax=Polaromonas sp. UC242_47 TaxID=3374626 RepID=UPI00378AE037
MADLLNGLVGWKKNDRTNTHHHFQKMLNYCPPISLVCKPTQRTQSHDKTEKQKLTGKMIDDEIEGCCSKPTIVKKAGAV